MTYANVADVRREFKSVLEAGTVITNDKIVEFLLQANSVINSYIGSVYTIPAVGIASINQKDTLTIAAINDNEDYFIVVESSGVKSTYTFNSGIGANAASIKTGLIASINSDKDRLIEVTDLAGVDFEFESRALGFSYTIESLSLGDALITSVNNQTASLGSTGLRLLRKIETELASCKIARILKTKVAAKLDASGVKQEIKDGSCAAIALSQLKDIMNGKIILDGAELANEGGGLESHNQVTGYTGFFDIEKQQW